MKLKSIKTYTNILIFTTVLLSIMASQFPQYSFSLLITSLISFGAMFFIHFRYWRCTKCKRWMGMDLNAKACPRCGKRINLEKEK
jgi:rubrerythrin